MRARFDPQITALKEENAALKGRIEKLEQKFAVAEQVEAAITKLDARALAREEGRRGKMGPQGQRGEKGERGLHGEKGEPGKAAEPVYIKSWQVDRGGYRASPVYSNGHVGGVLEIREFYEQFLSDRGEW
jgi:hypothetical protein